uniref:Uncharacterized protein n=1 Tax=Vitis vinifera TaxID=29760 RepID=A5B7C5_VITVI|nr:hypothetical protein VITISV_012615 [Vitis vinifera]
MFLQPSLARYALNPSRQTRNSRTNPTAPTLSACPVWPTTFTSRWKTTTPPTSNGRPNLRPSPGPSRLPAHPSGEPLREMVRSARGAEGGGGV